MGAHLDAERPTLPRGWDHWWFWQYTVTQVGTVPGIPGRVDRDCYCGERHGIACHLGDAGVVVLGCHLMASEDEEFHAVLCGENGGPSIAGFQRQDSRGDACSKVERLQGQA